MSCTVRQTVQDGRIGSQELGLDRIFLKHQVITFQLDVSIRILLCQIVLYLVDVLDQIIGRCKVDDQFPVGQ